MNDSQLLMISLFIVMIDAYLHIRDNRKNLTYSFIPTFIMISGLGIAIATREISTSNIIHYLVFGVMLLTVPIDQKRTLEMLGPISKRKGEEKLAIKKLPLLTNIIRFFAPLRSILLWKRPVKSVGKPSYKQMLLTFPKNPYTKTSDSENVKSIIDPSYITPKTTSVFHDKKVSKIQEEIDKISISQQMRRIYRDRETIDEDQTNVGKPRGTGESLGLDSIDILDSVYVNILVKTGVKTVDDLAKCTPKELLKTIDDYVLKNIVDYLEIVDEKMHINITEDITTTWIRAAKNLINTKFQKRNSPRLIEVNHKKNRGN
jgi:hypothetical protein